MSLATMAWANLWRKRGRTVFLLLAVAFSVGTLVSMLTVTRAMRQEIGQAFDEIGANVVVLPQTTRRYGYAGVTLPGASGEGRYLPEASANLVRTIKNKDNIAIVAPKLLAVIDTQSGPALAVGVRWPAELRLRKWWMVRASPAGKPIEYATPKSGPAPGPSDVILGSRMAAKLGVDVGGIVALGQVPFRVAGVLDPLGTDEDRAIWIDLGSLQGLAGLGGQISLLEVAALCNTCPIEEIVRQLSDMLPGSRVSAVKAAVAAREAVVDRFAQALSVAVAALGALAVVLTMLSSVRGADARDRHPQGLGVPPGAHPVSLLSGSVRPGRCRRPGRRGGRGGPGPGHRPAGGRSCGDHIVATTVARGGAAGALLAMLLASTAAAVQAARIDPVKALRLL